MTSTVSSPLTVAALYRFARIVDRDAVRDRLEHLCTPDVRGILLVAHEGLNGTIAGPSQAIDRVLDGIRALPGFADLDVKFATADTPPFRRMKVRIKAEIVTMGEPDLDPATGAGTYVSPARWNALIADPDTVIIDTRNDYEAAVGAFAGAVQPNTRSFRDFPDWFRTEGRALLEQTGAKRVAMYCTGGIRCEKTSAWMLDMDLPVYQLEGGILNYFQQMPDAQHDWRGECFVFDNRVAVDTRLQEAGTTLEDVYGDDEAWRLARARRLANSVT